MLILFWFSLQIHKSNAAVGSDKFDDDVQAFLKSESFPVVLKPTESAGSDGVKLCYTLEEAKEHFETLMKGQLVNGGDCPSVLCQEFLMGTEYVIDHVSRDGVHKLCMIWVYDKRDVNGANFVYYGRCYRFLIIIWYYWSLFFTTHFFFLIFILSFLIVSSVLFVGPAVGRVVCGRNETGRPYNAVGKYLNQLR